MTSTAAIPLADQALADRLTARLALVEEALRDAVGNADALADSASRHLVNAGGKRLRPLLTLLVAELGDGARREVIDAAVVVELTHLATLYHDDVMDSAPLRRGAPSAHEVWGNSVAILTGDLLFARASTTVAGLGPEAVRIQARTFERLCLGQLHETVGPRDGDDPVTHYLQVLADKTASLLATSARLGGRIDDLVPLRRRVAVDVLATRQVPRAATARVRMDYRTTGEVERRIRVQGRLLLTFDRGWRVFGFDVTQGPWAPSPAEDRTGREAGERKGRKQ